jgi:two-component system copper resistance phosphate regulon response regulator CusR
VRILLAEDDDQLRNTILRGLQERSFAVDAVADGEDALVHAATHVYDAMVLDVLMPRRDGIALCRELRGRGIHTPILLLTARDSVDDRITGLDAGADDYLTKPFAFGELLARLRALLRRRGDLVPTMIAVGDLEIDTRRQEARRDGRRVPLTAREYAFLEYLARHAGQIVSRAAIAAHVWDENHDPAANLIDVYVSRLRRKIDAGAAPLIHTRRGAGVLLAADAGPDDLRP